MKGEYIHWVVGWRSQENQIYQSPPFWAKEKELDKLPLLSKNQREISINHWEYSKQPSNNTERKPPLPAPPRLPHLHASCSFFLSLYGIYFLPSFQYAWICPHFPATPLSLELPSISRADSKQWEWDKCVWEKRSRIWYTNQDVFNPVSSNDFLSNYWHRRPCVYFYITIVSQQINTHFGWS